MNSVNTRRALLRYGCGVLAGAALGCNAAEIEPLAGNSAFFPKGGLRLLLVELVRGQRLAVSLTNTTDEVFVVYVTSHAAPSWHVQFEGGTRLTYAPASSEGRRPDIVCGYSPIATEYRLVRGASWSSIVDLDQALRPWPKSPEYARMPEVVERLHVQVIAPPELAVGYSGQYRGEPYDPKRGQFPPGHLRVGISQWSQYAIGGELQLVSPVRLLQPATTAGS